MINSRCLWEAQGTLWRRRSEVRTKDRPRDGGLRVNPQCTEGHLVLKYSHYLRVLSFV